MQEVGRRVTHPHPPPPFIQKLICWRVIVEALNKIYHKQAFKNQVSKLSLVFYFAINEYIHP